MKEELLAFSRALGFDECRVARASRAPHADFFRDWLAEGRAGEMNWLARDPERRSAPQNVLPGAESVIVLATNYYQGKAGDEGRGSEGKDPAPANQRLLSNSARRTAGTNYRDATRAATGRIARYAWGDDYHDVILEKLRIIDRWLAERGGVQRCYVDTGPVLERDFAALAGVGWHGKSTMLIHPRLGTWFFLCAILTTLSLEADSPVPDRCGRCNRCIEACPTQAISRAHQLDPRRCISYLTIELKGPIPEELRPLIGNRIFGCDDCLDVCPWNRFARESRETAFAAREFVDHPALRDFLAMNDAQFRARFRNSPIKRIKRRGFLRNVCVALGNAGTADDLPALKTESRDPEPLIAEHALWAIAQIVKRGTRNAESGISEPSFTQT